MSLWNDPAIPTTPAMLTTPSAIQSSSIEAKNGEAIVTQTYDTLRLVWTFAVTGNDLTAQIDLTNTANQPFDRPFFRLSQFHFARPPAGNMHAWHYTYYAPKWKDLAHPSVLSPLAVAEVHDDAFAIAVHCSSHFDKPVLINSNFSNNVIPADCTPYVYVQQTTAPGETTHYRLTVRITNQLDLASRLGAYVDDFRKFAGPMRYQPDDRPVIGCYPESTTWIKPTNPLGLSRRFDFQTGVAAFERMIAPATPYCQGPIFWQPQGANLRGMEFRPDFDVWPPSIQKNFPPLLAWCTSRGMRPGLQTRPASIVTPANATTDGEVYLSPDEPTHLTMLDNRFANTHAAGAREYYLDSFGADLRSYRIMQHLREKLGPTIPTYSEYSTDLILPLSGGYCDLRQAPATTTWFDLETLQIFRLLYPNSSFICKSLINPDPAKGIAQETWDQFASAKLSPILFDGDAAADAPALKEMLAKYYNGNVWNSAAGSLLAPTTQP